MSAKRKRGSRTGRDAPSVERAKRNGSGRADGGSKRAAPRDGRHAWAAGIARRAWFWPAIVFAVALVLRLAYVFEVRFTPFFQTLGLDAKFYDQWAREIAAGARRGDAFFMSPLYPYFLAGVYRLFGRDLLAVRVVQAFVGSFSAVLIYLLGRETFGRTVALVSGFVAASYGAFIFYDGSILMTPLLVFLNLAAVLLLLRADATGRAELFVAAGAVLGLAAIGRAAVLAFVPVALGWMVWAGSPASARGRAEDLPVGRPRLSGRLLAMLFFMLGIVLTVAPVTVRNRVVAGDFVLITSNGGLNFYIGNSEISTGGYVKPDGLDIVTDPDGASIAEAALGRSLRPSEVSAYWFSRARDYIKKNPSQWGRLLLRKLSFVMSAYELPQLENYYFQKRYSRLLSFPLPSFGVVAPLGVVGLALSFRRRRAALVGLFAATYLLSIVTFFVVARYRLPVVPAFILGASYVAVDVWERVRRREWRGLIPRAVAVGAVAVLVNANLYGVDRGKAFAQAHFRLGIIYGDRGEKDRAIAEYTRSIEIDPDYPKSYLNLGALLAESGRPEEAVDAFRRAVDLDPGYTAARVNLGMALAEAGDEDAALAELEEAVERDPSSAMALTQYGIELYRVGRLEEARATLERAAENDDGGEYGPEVAFYLSRIDRPGPRQLPEETGRALAEADSLVEDGRPSEAAEVLERAIELAPDSGEPLMRLALLKRDLGLLREAVDLMEQALRVDPALPHGHFNMGVLLNQIGDHDGAIREYEAELRLAPEAAAAHLNLALTYQFHLGEKNLAARHYMEYLRLGGRPVPALEKTLEEVGVRGRGGN